MGARLARQVVHRQAAGLAGRQAPRGAGLRRHLEEIRRIAADLQAPHLERPLAAVGQHQLERLARHGDAPLAEIQRGQRGLDPGRRAARPEGPPGRRQGQRQEEQQPGTDAPPARATAMARLPGGRRRLVVALRRRRLRAVEGQIEKPAGPAAGALIVFQWIELLDHRPRDILSVTGRCRCRPAARANDRARVAAGLRRRIGAIPPNRRQAPVLGWQQQR